MLNWIKKSIIITVALLTFGAITPTHDIWNGLQDKNSSKQAEGSSASQTDYYAGISESAVVEDLQTIDDAFIIAARAQTYKKFGSKIGPVITAEFDEVIFPKIDEAIRMTINDAAVLEKKRLSISERPTGNYSEKIFHVFDKAENKDLIRFHVRTEKRPQDGYFFNFHYHVAEDNFTTHHTIGEIYWSKNTPPKWLT